MESQTEKEMRERLVKSFLDVIILFELRKSKHLSGYDVLELVHAKFLMFVSPGSIYSLLYAMERKGLISSDYDEGKRVYMLAEKGSSTLQAIVESKEEIQRFFQTLLQG